MTQFVPILAVIVWVVTFLLYRPAFFRRPLTGERRWLLALLQVIPLLLLVWLLGNPASKREKTEKQEGVVVFLLDDSPSMGMEDGQSGRLRIDVAHAWMKETLENKASNGAPGKWVEHTLNDLIPEGRSGSDFAAAFEALSKRIPQRLLDGVVFVSDGRDHSQGSVLESVKRLGVPVHTLGIGPEIVPEEIRVRWREVPEQVNPGSPFLVEWAIDSEQDLETLFNVRVEFASEEFHRESIALPEGRSHETGWVTLRSQIPGSQLLRIEIQNANDPESAATAEAKIVVRDQPKSLLILESEPSRLVRSLSQIALESGRFRILRPVSLPEGGGVVWDLVRPVIEQGDSVEQLWNREEYRRFGPGEWSERLEDLLAQVSVVVLGRNPLSRAPENWVTSLETAVGRTDLGWLALPGSEEILGQDSEDSSFRNLLERMANRKESADSLRMVIDETGKDHPALAPLWSFQDGVWEIGMDAFFRSSSPTTQVLIDDTQARNLIVQVPFGLGKATMVSTANLWRLGFSDTTGNRESDFLAGLWLGILDDLSAGERGDEISIVLEPETPTLGQSTRIRVQDPAIRPGPPRAGLEIKSPNEDWETLLVAPDPQWAGVGEAAWTPRSGGDYEIRYASDETPISVTVADRPAETEDLALNESLLKRISEASGGSYSDLGDFEPAILDRMTREHSTTRVEKTLLRHDVWMGVLIAGLFCLGWGIRRAWSLP